MKHPQLSGIATALAAQGRHGDDTLIHVSRKELATLKKYSDELGLDITTNPQTGLPEAFNWGGMAGSVGLPLLVLAATAATGGAATPLMLAAAGAAGGFGGTLAGGGSTDQALMSGVMGGIGGYGMGGVAEGLAQAGMEKAVETGVEQTAATQLGGNIAQATASQAPEQIVEQGLTTSTGQVIAPGTLEGAANNIAQAPMGADVTQLIPKGYELGSGQLGNQVAALQGNAPLDYASAVGQSVDTMATAAKPTGLEAMKAGWEQVSASPKALGSFAMDQAKNIGAVGIGTLGVGANMNPQEQTIQTEPETQYEGEMYMDPETGQWRSRAVKKADGGSVFSDYDAADVEKDGGYAPGGYLNLATGGSATSSGLASIGKGVPSVDNPDAVFPEWWVSGKELGPTRRQDGLAAGGGIGDLGGYSDGGRLLRGPGDGVSDNIPATIENKRPARLADGEFVIPARAVSELGNGSTEAGSKQLYKMLDRIAQKRKSGKGLAYEANPKKLMPV